MKYLTLVICLILSTFSTSKSFSQYEDIESLTLVPDVKKNGLHSDWLLDKENAKAGIYKNTSGREIISLKWYHFKVFQS